MRSFDLKLKPFSISSSLHTAEQTRVLIKMQWIISLQTMCNREAFKAGLKCYRKSVPVYKASKKHQLVLGCQMLLSARVRILETINSAYTGL